MVEVWDFVMREFGFPATWGLTGSQLILTQAHFENV